MLTQPALRLGRALVNGQVVLSPDATQIGFGEDLAGAGELLLTDHRDDAVQSDPYLAEMVHTQIWPASARLEARPKRKQVAERTQKRPRLAQA